MEIASSGFGGFFYGIEFNRPLRITVVGRWFESTNTQSHCFEISRDFMIMYVRDVNEGVELPLCVTCNTVSRLLQSGWSINTSWLLQRYWLHPMSKCQWSNLEGYDNIYPSISNKNENKTPQNAKHVYNSGDVLYFLHAAPWIPDGGQSIFTVVIHWRRSTLHQFVRVKTIEEYKVTKTVPRVRVTSHVHCADVAMDSRKDRPRFFCHLWSDSAPSKVRVILLWI